MPGSIRGSDVFLKEDIKNVLEGLAITIEASIRSGAVIPGGYYNGFMSCMLAVGRSFDIDVDTRITRGSFSIFINDRKRLDVKHG